MSDANGAANASEPQGTEPGESASAPEPKEPRLHADAPAGLAPPPGLPPSPGIRAPEITVPPGFGLTDSPETNFDAPTADFGAAAPDGFASVFDTPSVQAQAAQREQLEAQARQHAQAQEAQAQAQAQAQEAQAQVREDQAPTSTAPATLSPATAASATPSPATAAPPAPPAKKPGLSAAAITGIVAGSIAVVVVLILVSVLASRGDGSATAPARLDPGLGDTPTAAVEGFLTALAEGDAETAALLTGADRDEPLLSDEALARSIELAPITGIMVEEAPDEDSRAVVSASFRIGDRTVARDFTVWHTSGAWELSDALVSLPLSGLEGLDATVNGIAPGTDDPLVFPGSYEIEVGLGGDAFELSADGQPLDVLSIVSSEDALPLYWAEPKVTEARTQEFRALVRASLEACLAMPQLSTPCGLDVSEPLDDGAIPVEGSAQRALSSEGEQALDELTPTLDYTSSGRVTTFDHIFISTHIEADRGGEIVRGTLYSSGELLQPYVDFSEEEPRVTWE